MFNLLFPLRENLRGGAFWEEMEKKVAKQSESWKGRSFSLGGRVALIQTCLSSIPIYCLSLFRIPCGVVG